MSKIEEYMAWVSKSKPLPVGFRWEYHALRILSSTYDKLYVVDPKGKRIAESHIIGITERSAWGRAADRAMSDLASVFMRYEHENPVRQVSSTLKDMGERTEPKAIEAPKDKTKGFWGWLYK